MVKYFVVASALLTASFDGALAQDRPVEADSIVLERTTCYWGCPAYRLRVTRTGQVSFQSRTPGEESRRFTGALSLQDVAVILTAAQIANFLALPDRIADDPHFCPQQITDLPGAIVTLYLPHQIKQVADYQGCTWAPAALRELEDRIDTMTHSARWARPVGRH